MGIIAFLAIFQALWSGMSVTSFEGVRYGLNSSGPRVAIWTTLSRCEEV